LRHGELDSFLSQLDSVPSSNTRRTQPTRSSAEISLEPLRTNETATTEPPSGAGLGEADVTVCPDWTGLPWVRPFWAGFRPCRENPAPTPRVSILVKKKLQSL